MKISDHKFNSGFEKPLVFIVSYLLFFSVSGAFAQEHSFDKEEQEHHINFESGLNHESETIHSKPASADTLTLYRPLITRPKPKQSEARNHEDEDALKFNFLYFIIQKFKFSDIIE